MPHFVFVAIDARFSHSNPAIRSILAHSRKVVPESDLPQITLLESNINQRVEILAGDLLDLNPDALFFSCYIWNIRVIQDLLTRIRPLLPNCLFVLGGPEVEHSPELSLREIPEADLILCGEGEAIFPTLFPRLKEIIEKSFQPSSTAKRQGILASLAKEKDKIAGLAFLLEKEFIQSPRPAFADLDQIPFLYPDPVAIQHRHVYYESSRGCPFRCSYCLSAKDKPMRWRKLELVKEDLRRLQELGYPLVKWIDRSFNADPKRAREIWCYLIDLAGEKPSTRWHFEIEAQLLNEEDLDLLSKAPLGLFQFEIGIQSFDPRTLRAVNRSPETEGILNALRRLNQDGKIHCHADLIFGLPGENMEMIARSFRLVCSSAAEQIQLGFLKLLKGSPLYDAVKGTDYRFLPYAPYEVLQSDALSAQDLLSLKRMESVFERFWNGDAFAKSRDILIQLNQPAMERDWDFVQGLINLNDKQAKKDEDRIESCSPQKSSHFDLFNFFMELGSFFHQKGFSHRPFSQDEFFWTVAVAMREFDTPISRQIEERVIADYEALPRGALDSFEHLERKYSKS